MRRDDHGTAIVETAITMLFLFIVLFAIIEGCRMLMIQQVLTNAAREGARFAVLPLTQTNTMPTHDAVIAKAHEYLDSGGVSSATVSVVDIPTPCDTPPPDCVSVVHVEIPYQIVSLSMLKAFNLTLKAESMMRKETAP